MLHWIAQHSGGWQVLVPAVVIFCILGVHLERYQPLTFGAVWLAGIAGMYVMAGIGAMLARDPRYWAALVAMAAIGVAIPLAAAYASAGLLRRAQPAVRWSVAAIAGLLGVPLTTIVAANIGDRVIPMLLRQAA